MAAKQDNRLQAAKWLLEKHSSPIDSTTLFNGMVVAGLAESRTYLSSTGSGEIKQFLALTEAGLAYGINQASSYSERTELRFFDETFPQLLVLVSKAILAHSVALL